MNMNEHLFHLQFFRDHLENITCFNIFRSAYYYFSSFYHHILMKTQVVRMRSINIFSLFRSIVFVIIDPRM